MAERQLEGLMSVTLEKIKEMTGSNTIIGEPIVVDGATILPVSKVTFGFAGGGSDFGAKTTKELFGGGTGAGVSVTPVAFLIVKDGSVRLLPVAPPAGDSVGRVVDLVPEMFEKVTGYIDKKTGTDKSGE